MFGYVDLKSTFSGDEAMPNTKRTYVLDTSVMLYSSNSLSSFAEHNVVLPYVVLEELDRFKGRDDVVGGNARAVARRLNELRHKGPINEGVEVNDLGGKLRVELNFHESVSIHLDIKQNDDRILNVCLGLLQQGEDVRLVTKDINLAVRADVLGVIAEDFHTDRTVSSVAEMYTGSTLVHAPNNLIDALYLNEEVYPEELCIDTYPNEYLTLVSLTDSGKSGLARSQGPLKPLVKLKNIKNMWGISPRNREQHFAMDALLNPDIKLVSLTGKAGCGKTLVALACALHQVQDKVVYNRLVVSRPVQPLGKDIGFLPGSVQEKLDPWMGPIKDSLEFLTRGKDKNRDIYEEMVGMKMLEIEPLTYIRGRSMPNTIFILDEAQDLTRAEIKTIVSRMGEGSKLVLIGDVLQISNPYLDSTNNGLSNVVEKFKPYSFAAHVTLSKGERSELATVASEIL